MSVFDTLEFSCRLMLSVFEMGAWVWAIILFLFSLVFLGVFWGLAWNKQWSFFGHPGWAFVSALFSVAIGGSTLAWFGADRTAFWLTSQRDIIAHDVASSGVFNREVLRAAWDKLQPAGGQPENLRPPAEGGTEIQLNNENDARVLALAAAENVKRHIQSREPFSQGVPCVTRDPAAVAEETVAAIHNATYPVTVGATNEWSKQAVKSEVNSAMEAAGKALVSPDTQLKTGLIWLGAILLLTQLGYVALAALSDIKEYPKP